MLVRRLLLARHRAPAAEERDERGPKDDPYGEPLKCRRATHFLHTFCIDEDPCLLVERQTYGQNPAMHPLRMAQGCHQCV